MDPKLFLFNTLLLSVFKSFKKDKPTALHREIRLVDFDSKLPIENAHICCIRDEFLETPMGRCFLPYTYQTLHSDDKGFTNYNILNEGYLTILADGYMSRKISMAYAMGDLDMLKSTQIEVVISDEHIANDTISQLDVIREDDLHLPFSIRESFELAYQSIAYPTGNYVVHFDGLANRENKIKLTFFSESIWCDSISIVPIPGLENKLQFKY